MATPNDLLKELDNPSPPAEIMRQAREDAAAKEALLPKVQEKPPGESVQMEPEEKPPGETVALEPARPEPPPYPVPDPFDTFRHELAARDAKIAELEAWRTQQQQQAASAQETAEEQRIVARQEQVERETIAAIQAGDVATQHQLQFEHQKLGRMLSEKQSLRLLRESRVASAPPPLQNIPPPQDIKALRQAELFIEVNRLSVAEQRKVVAEVEKLVVADPGWLRAEPWHRFDAALKNVRKPGRAVATAGEAPAMEGGGGSQPTRAVPSLKNYPSIDYAKAARVMGYTQDEYAKLIEGKR